MMKFLFMILFMIPLSLYKKSYWMVQLMLILLMFKYIMVLNNSLIFNKISYFMGLDMLSYGLIILSVWICFLMILASESIYKHNYNYKFFNLNILLLLLFLILSFSSMNLFYFYLFFEISLIPTLFLILGWGYQPERIQAGIYLLFYTLLVSFPMLLSIFYIYMKKNSLFMNFFMELNFNYLFYFSMLLVF